MHCCAERNMLTASKRSLCAFFLCGVLIPYHHWVSGVCIWCQHCMHLWLYGSCSMCNVISVKLCVNNCGSPSKHWRGAWLTLEWRADCDRAHCRRLMHICLCIHIVMYLNVSLKHMHWTIKTTSPTLCLVFFIATLNLNNDFIHPFTFSDKKRIPNE